MATATREAYGKALAKLVQEREDIVVLDADLTKSTKRSKPRKLVHKDISIWGSPKAT